MQYVQEPWLTGDQFKISKIFNRAFYCHVFVPFFLYFTHFENKMKNLNNLCNNSSRTSHLYLGSCLEETELYHHTEFQNLYLPLILCSPKEIYRTKCFAWLCTNVVFLFYCVYVCQTFCFIFIYFLYNLSSYYVLIFKFLVYLLKRPIIESCDVNDVKINHSFLQSDWT